MCRIQESERSSCVDIESNADMTMQALYLYMFFIVVPKVHKRDHDLLFVYFNVDYIFSSPVLYFIVSKEDDTPRKSLVGVCAIFLKYFSYLILGKRKISDKIRKNTVSYMYIFCAKYSLIKNMTHIMNFS